MTAHRFEADDLLSIVVISYENQRELPRTLHSLSPHYQEGVTGDQYEIVVVDNGSKKPPRAKHYADLGVDLSVVVMEEPTHSPVRAINRGIEASVGAAVTVFIDGARLASPGLVRGLREGLMLDRRVVVGSRGRYLGPVPQRVGMRYGYNRKVEDAMLERIDWKNNGYRLFEVSIFDEPSTHIWLSQVGESNSITMSRRLWAELGGYDERFESKGGGYVNLDTWRRACELPGVRPVLLLGEATFHQFHGGVATNAPRREVNELHQEYKQLRGRAYRRPSTPATFHGTFRHTPPPNELLWTEGVNFIDLIDPAGPMAGMLPELRSATDQAAATSPPPAGKATKPGARRGRRAKVKRVLVRLVPRRLRPRVKALARKVRR